MAVLSEPVADPSSASDRSYVVLAPDSKKIRARIESELRRSEEDPALLFVDGVEELIDLGAEAPKLAVLVCDLDRPAEMAILRRVRRKLQRLAIVVVSPPATATGVRRALDAGADAIVFEPLIEATLAVTVEAVGSGQAVVPRELRASVQRPTLGWTP